MDALSASITSYRTYIDITPNTGTPHQPHPPVREPKENVTALRRIPYSPPPSFPQGDPVPSTCPCGGKILICQRPPRPELGSVGSASPDSPSKNSWAPPTFRPAHDSNQTPQEGKTAPAKSPRRPNIEDVNIPKMPRRKLFSHGTFAQRVKKPLAPVEPASSIALPVAAALLSPNGGG